MARFLLVMLLEPARVPRCGGARAKERCSERPRRQRGPALQEKHTGVHKAEAKSKAHAGGRSRAGVGEEAR